MDQTNFYEKWAQEEHFAREEYIHEVQALKAGVFINLLNKAAVSISSIVDVGCSTGIMLKKIGTAFSARNLLGIDISEKIINKAKTLNANLANLSFHRTDGSPEDISNTLHKYCQMHRLDKFDAAMMVDFLEHVLNPIRYINALKPYCKLFLIKIPIENTWWDNAFMARIGKKQWPGNTHPDGHLWELGYSETKHFISDIGLIPIMDTYWKHPDFVQFAPDILEKWKNKPFMKRIKAQGRRIVYTLIKTLCNVELTMRLIGGSYFCIARSITKEST